METRAYEETFESSLLIGIYIFKRKDDALNCFAFKDLRSTYHPLPERRANFIQSGDVCIMQGLRWSIHTEDTWLLSIFYVHPWKSQKDHPLPMWSNYILMGARMVVQRTLRLSSVISSSLPNSSSDIIVLVSITRLIRSLH